MSSEPPTHVNAKHVPLHIETLVSTLFGATLASKSDESVTIPVSVGV